MIITLGGLPVTFIEKPNITDSLDSSNNTFEFTVLGSIPKIYGQIVTIRTIKSGQIYKGIFIGAKINPGPPRKTAVRCIGMDYLTECKVLSGLFSGDATDVLRQLCDASGIRDLLGYPVSPIDTQVELELNGEYLRQALDLFCQNIGAYWRVTTDQGVLEIFLPDSATTAPHNVTLPFHNCNNEQQLLDLEFENTPNAISTVIVAGKNSPLEYSSVTLNTRLEDIVTQLKPGDENKIFELLEGATRIVYVDLVPKSSGGNPLFAFPRDIVFDSEGNAYIADSSNTRIRKVNNSNILSTYAGTGTGYISGDGGPAVDAEIYSIQSLAIDSADNLYLLAPVTHRVRKINAITGIIDAFAGNGVEGDLGNGGPAVDAQLHNDYAISINGGNLYISHAQFGMRYVDISSGIIDEFIPLFPGFDILNACWYGSNLYFIGVDDTMGGSFVNKRDSFGTFTTIAGIVGVNGYSGDGGPAISAAMNFYSGSGLPNGIDIDSDGNLYIADTGNNVIRKVDTVGNISTFAGDGTAGYSGDGGLATDAQLNEPSGIRINDNYLYICDTFNNCIRRVDLSTNIITLFAGTPSEEGGFGGDGGPATP